MRLLRLIGLLLTVTVPACAAAQHHMIAAANPHAAEAGLAMLRKGGSAVDAAIASQMVLTLVEPESSGIGGGAFMLLWDPKARKVTSFDGRETAPASARPDMFLDRTGHPRAPMDAIPGGLSVGVPGVLAMLEMAHKKYGRLPWADLFQPAIHLAEHGVKVGPKLARILRQFANIAAMPDLKAAFSRPDGELLREGDILKNEQLAASLRIIAKDGARAFYTGKLAAAIVDKVRHAPVNPGGMGLHDLARYRAVERAPVCGAYRAYRVCSMGPPSSGGIAVLQILAMLERFPSADLMPDRLPGLHHFAQASRLAFADRAAYLGDPAFVRVPERRLLNRTYLAARSRLIDPARDMGTAKPGRFPGLRPTSQRLHEIGGTSHMAIVDDQGMAVSMTTTVEYVFGSEMMVGGFVLNNQLTDFSFAPVRDGRPAANAPAAGKRPLSSMSPTLVFDTGGDFRIALGSPGGPAIIPYVTGTLLAMLDGGLSPDAAVRLPHAVETNGPLRLEETPELKALTPSLAAMGYTVESSRAEISGLHIVAKTAQGYVGAADPRRDGVALGD